MDNEKDKSKLPHLISITKNVARQYAEDIKGNKGTDYLIARKKITRNWILSEFINEDHRYIWKHYGNLILRYEKGEDRIVNIYNDKSKKYTFNIDWDLKAMLDSIYGLDQEENYNTYNNEIKIKEDNTYEEEKVNNKTIANLYIDCIARFGRAFKGLRG